MTKTGREQRAAKDGCLPAGERAGSAKREDSGAWVISSQHKTQLSLACYWHQLSLSWALLNMSGRHGDEGGEERYVSFPASALHLCTCRRYRDSLSSSYRGAYEQPVMAAPGAGGINCGQAVCRRVGREEKKERRLFLRKKNTTVKPVLSWRHICGSSVSLFSE